jgi:transketolase
MNSFGASAPGAECFAHFEITAAAVAAAAQEQL